MLTDVTNQTVNINSFSSAYTT